MSKAALSENPLNKVLIVNIFGLGDVLFTTPLIHNLKQHKPDLKIGYLCNRRAQTILEQHPHIDRCHVYARDEFAAVAQKSWFAYVKRVLNFIREIRQAGYDLVLDVSLNTFMSFLTWRAGIPVRMGLDYQNRSTWLTHKVPLAGYTDKHVADYYLDLLAGMNIPVSARALFWPVPSGDKEWAGSFLSRRKLNNAKKLIALVPGGGASWGKDAVYKRWPSEKYAKLADKLIDNLQAAIILMGDASEVGLIEAITGSMKHQAVSAAGQTNPGQFAALAGQCTLVVTNDGGPLHMAVAAGARTISLFGPVDETVYGPYPSAGHHVISKNIPCRPCYRKFRRARCGHVSCLRELTVDEVFEAIMNGLSGN